MGRIKPLKINSFRKQVISENLLYAFVWIAVLLVPVLNTEMLTDLHVDLDDLLRAWMRIGPYLLLFFLHNLFIAPRLLLRKRYVWYIVVNLATIVVLFSMVDVYERYIITRLKPEEIDMFIGFRKASFTDLALYWNVVLGLFMTGMNAAIKLLYKSMRDEQVLEALQRQNLQTEMEYLKYQINPHFFMNTLNNIHALIDIDADAAKKSVIDLSKMMRYVLYDSESHDIPLRRDIEFIDNYIRLMRIRYDEGVDLRFDYPSDIAPSVVIPPLLLIVFVENAFKHGISYRNRSFIRIEVQTERGFVCLRTCNSRHPEPAGHKHGIGLENVRKRLELIYGEDFTLRIDNSSPEVYKVELKIPMTHD